MITPITLRDAQIQVPCAQEQISTYSSPKSLYFSSSEQVRENGIRFGVCTLCFFMFIVLAWAPEGQAQASTAGNGTDEREELLDPILSYSTYLSDVGAPPGFSAVDSAGNVCVVVGPVLTRLRSDGSVVYSKGDSGWTGEAAAIDSQGNCYVAGGGKIAPTPGAFQATAPGSEQFVMKFDAAGQIVYATYLGGSGNGDVTLGLAVDALGNAYLSGSTNSNDFPTAHAFQPTFGGGNVDAFVAVLNASGTGLVYSTYLGGSGNDVGNGIAVDSSGNAYITGDTSSPNFPTNAAFQPNLGGTRSAFVVKLDSSGTMIYSTFLGGTDVSFGTGISVDTSGNAYVAGTAGAGFPLVNPLQSPNSSSSFIAKLNASGSALLFSTYFGFNVSGAKIAVDSNQRIYIAGEASTTSSVGSVSSLQQNFGGGSTDGYVSVLDASGPAVVFSTLLGGSGDEQFSSLGVDSSGNIYISGTTDGTFPIVNAENGTYEPFVVCAPHSICGGRLPIQAIALKVAPVSGTVLAFPSLVDFRGEPEAIGMSTDAVSILVANPNSSNNITISGIVVAGDFSQTNSCPQTLGPGASCTLSATFTPTSAGTRTGTITITDSAPGSPHTINLIGTTLVAQVDITPTQLSFTSELVGGTSSPQTVTLTNTGGAPLSIQSISVLGDFAESNDCGVSVATSTTCQIVVTFTPTVAGNRTGTLTVVYTATGSPQTVPLSGIGTNAALGLGLTPGGSSSATVAAGQAASYAFSIGGAGMSGAASLSCTGAPTGATCSIPNTEPLSSTVPTTFNVSVTTTSRTLGALRPPATTPMPWLLTVAVLGMLVRYGTRMPRLAGRRYLWLAPLALSFLQISCGGGSSTQPNPSSPNPNGTPAGTYTMTVKATSGSTTETSSLTLIVQ
jgi:WD40 repeat protein